MLSVALNYAGMGRLFSKGRDISKKLFKVSSKTSEKAKQLHDAVYAVVYCGTFQPAFYYVADVRDLKETAIGMTVVMGVALEIGGPVGYAIDIFRDLTGIKETERIP